MGSCDLPAGRRHGAGLGGVVVLLGLVCAAVAWWPGTGWASAAGAAGQPADVPGGEVAYALAVLPDGLDPALRTDGRAFLVAGQVLETLVRFEPGSTVPVPGLAESWTVSPDGLIWTFTLRPGLEFHDGTSLDAAAVVYNIERWWDPAHPFHDGAFEYFAVLFLGFRGDPACLLSDVSAVGSNQVQIILSRPYGPLLSNLAMTPFAIASPAAIQAGSLEVAPVGSGPFRFVAWVPDEEIHLAANPEYWGDGPFLQDLRFVAIPDPVERFEALQADAVQVAADLGASYVITASQDAALKVEWQPALNTGYLGINRAHPPLDNPLVRQAIAHAIDKQAIVDASYNADVEVAQVATQLLPPAIWGRSEDVVDYTYDPDLARALLDQAGYPDGVATNLWVIPIPRFYFPDPAGIAAAIQANLQTAGITATLVTDYDWPTYLERVRNGEADLFMLGWGSDNGHPDNFFYPLLCSSYQQYGPRDDVLCQQLEAAWALDDMGMLQSVYAWASQRVHATLPLIPMAHCETPVFLRSNLFGPVPTSAFFGTFQDVFLASDWAVVTPDAGASLTYVDDQGSPTAIEVPAGAVTQATTLALTPWNPVPPPAGRSHAHHAFRLEAYRGRMPIAGFGFEVPVGVTVQYTEADVAGLREETLALRAWDGSGWSADGIVLLGRDLPNNRLSVTVAHLSRFALLAQPPHTAYLPLVERGRR